MSTRPSDHNTTVLTQNEISRIRRSLDDVTTKLSVHKVKKKINFIYFFFSDFFFFFAFVFYVLP